MSRMPTLTIAPDSLLLARNLALAGIRAERTTDEHGRAPARIRRGAYSFAFSDDAGLQYALRVRAALAVRADAAAAGMSAAALYGLPLIGRWPTEIRLLAPGSHARRRGDVVEIPRWGREECLVLDDMALMAPADTAVEVARTAPFLTALVMVDALLASDRFAPESSLTTLDAVWQAWERRMPFRGAERAARVIEFARSGAESALETVSRVTAYELGFPEPILQYRMPLSAGLGEVPDEVYLDLAWPEFRVAGEADGISKYFRPRFKQSVSPEDRLLREKLRDRNIRQQGWTPAHWVWADAWGRTGMGVALRGAGLPVTRRPVRLR